MVANLLIFSHTAYINHPFLCVKLYVALKLWLQFSNLNEQKSNNNVSDNTKSPNFATQLNLMTKTILLL